jgi:hypothetical protein
VFFPPICGILNDDSTLARVSDLGAGLQSARPKDGAIADLEGVQVPRLKGKHYRGHDEIEVGG